MSPFTFLFFHGGAAVVALILTVLAVVLTAGAVARAFADTGVYSTLALLEVIALGALGWVISMGVTTVLGLVMNAASPAFGHSEYSDELTPTAAVPADR